MDKPKKDGKLKTEQGKPEQFQEETIDKSLAKKKVPRSKPKEQKPKTKGSKKDMLYIMRHNEKLFPTTHGNALLMYQRNEIIEGLGLIIRQYLLCGDDIQIPYLGTLKKVKTAKRTVHVPTVQGEIAVEEGYSIKFVPSKEFKELLRKPKEHKDEQPDEQPEELP